MYKRIAERRIRAVFDHLTRGEFDAALADAADDVHHVFPGDNAVGGERHSKEAMRRWLERLHRLFPELVFEVERVGVRGWPWDMWVSVKWSDRGRAADGVEYRNAGAHWIRLRRAKAVQIQAYLDTEQVSEACRRMAAAGIEEAAAQPITG
jgi:ketosteroid isomerase-like protein